MFARVLLVLLALAFIGAHSTSARAEVWGYVDDDGNAHVATEKKDERYQLFFKGTAAAGGDAAATTGASPPPRALRETPLYKRLVDHPNIVRYEALIEQNARARGLEPALVKAVIAVESGFDPAAVSVKGALGLMQVMPDTGARYGVAADRKHTLREKLLDPAINLRIGTTYLRELLTLFAADIDLALAAYNAGEQTVLSNHNRIPPFPETREYVSLVQQFYELYRPPAARNRPTAPPRIVVSKPGAPR